MAQPKRNTIEIQDLRGGRNGTDSPQAIGMNQCVEAWDVDWFTGLLARKRVGSLAFSLTSGPTREVGSLLTWRPTVSAVYLLSFSNNVGTIEVHQHTGSAWGAITMGDAGADHVNAVAASLNGSAYLGYDTAVNRLHALDTGTTTIRRVGLALPAAPTVANTGAGAYAATLRYYKVAYAVISGSVTLRRSELSAAVSFTPSGAGTAARVTKPAALGEGETHWLLYASADNLSYYLIATTVVGTTTYDDSATPSAYTGDAPQLTGTNIPPPSVKAILSDGARLVMAIPWESSAASGETEIKQNRVWFTRLLGASGIGDLETIPVTVNQKNYIDIGELNDDGAITGLGGPIDSVIYAFQANRIVPLLPTGDGENPYAAPRTLTTVIGAVNHKCIVMAEDEGGQPAIYFISQRGPYRIGRNGLESLTANVEDLFAGARALDETIHGIYHKNRRQIWWTAETSPQVYTILVYDIKHGAFSRYTVPQGVIVKCSCLFFDATLGTLLVPYLGGKLSDNALIRRYDNIYTASPAADDAGAAYRGYIVTRAYVPAGIGQNIEMQAPSLLALASSGTTITINAIRDFGISPTASGTVLLTPTGSATRVLGVAQDCTINAVGVIQYEIGDASAIAKLWTLDGFSAPYEVREARQSATPS